MSLSLFRDALPVTPTEIGSQSIEEASDGQKLVSLLIDSQSWVHRRVDALRLGADGTTRLHMSLDVTVPTDRVLKRPGEQMAVPLAFMEKAAIRQLDTEDSSLGKQFLFVVQVADGLVGRRVILKYSVDLDAPRISLDPTKRAIFALEVPDFGFAASQHMEVELPEGVVLERPILEEATFQGTLHYRQVDDTPKRWSQRTVGHVAMRPTSRRSAAELWVVAAEPRTSPLMAPIRARSATEVR